MDLFFRYCAFVLLSLCLPAFLVAPTLGEPSGAVDLLVRIMVLPIYGCLAVMLMTGLKPARMRQRLEQSPNPIDDLHLWLGPFMVILAFFWAGFMLIGLLAIAGFHENHPIVFLGLAVGGIVLAIWMGVKVRRAFLYGSA